MSCTPFIANVGDRVSIAWGDGKHSIGTISAVDPSSLDLYDIKGDNGALYSGFNINGYRSSGSDIGQLRHLIVFKPGLWQDIAMSLPKSVSINWGGTANCLVHDPVDTGMRRSWCRACDCDMMLGPDGWEAST